MIYAGRGNLTHTVDEAVRKRAVLLNGCSVYAIHFTPQEMHDRKIFPLNSGTRWVPREPDQKKTETSDGWGEV